ncbi:MAG TPA: hypothetical protein VLI45_05120 [Acidobacteriaceae bacterium]|nr:hypothetical protein [Acidobacteriaceae bacterium]
MSIRRLRSLACIATTLLFAVACGHAQQNYVGRYSAYVGFADIDSPILGLNEQGFHAQFGVNTKTWLGFGGDYSVARGGDILTPNLLPASLQAQIGGAEAAYIAAGLLPPNYTLRLRTDASTQTFGAGPQVAYRRFTRATLFAHPSFGALREHAVPRPADPFQKVVVTQLAPAGYKTDWTATYGVGGGGEFIVNHHLTLRGQMEIVWNHPFNDILAEGRWTFRYAVGPSFQFGRNVPRSGRP